MASLFQFHADRVEVTKEVAQIKDFKKILERDDAEQCLAYIYFLCDWGSHYNIYDDEERKERCIEEVLGGDKKKAEDKDILKAVEKYIELSSTPSLKLLESARKGIRTLQEYFENVDPESEDKPGSSAKDLVSNLKSVGDLIKKMSEWEEVIKKEKDQSLIRRGVEIDKYNEG